MEGGLRFCDGVLKLGRGGPLVLTSTAKSGRGILGARSGLVMVVTPNVTPIGVFLLETGKCIGDIQATAGKGAGVLTVNNTAERLVLAGGL